MHPEWLTLKVVRARPHGLDHCCGLVKALGDEDSVLAMYTVEVLQVVRCSMTFSDMHLHALSSASILLVIEYDR